MTATIIPLAPRRDLKTTGGALMRLVCRWRTDPHSGRLLCGWPSATGLLDEEPPGRLRRAA